MKKYNKIVKKLISCLICTCMAILAIPVFVNAADDTSLTLHYGAGETTFEFYKVAAFDETEIFELEKPFSEYVNTVSNLDNLEEMTTEGWVELAVTLEYLVMTEGIEPVEVLKSDSEGLLKWEGIPKGLYLLLGEQTSDDEYIYTPAPTFVIIPAREEEGDWASDVEVNHNKIEIEPLIEYTELKVMKVWEDTGNEKNRPSFIEVSLYKEKEKVETIKLNEENNWTYTWEYLDEAQRWSIKEENVPDGYTVKYSEEGEGIVIVNTYKISNTPDKTNPSNLPTGQLWWPVPVLTALGLLALIIGVIRRRA